MSSLKQLATLSILAATSAADIYEVNLPAWDLSGPQSAIGSWYRASAGADFTNGKSWCAYSYFNSDSIFAPSLKAMDGHTYNSDPVAWKKEMQKFCGLEAKVTDPSTGKTSLLYIGDSFDDNWIKQKGSIDIMIDAFSNLHGNPNGDKNKVNQPVKWELTGRVNTKYAAAGASWPPAAGPSSSVKPKASKTSTSSQSLSQTPRTCVGCLGTKCDRQTTVCNDGLSCLSPNGVCSNAACNWGCAGWSCSDSSQCQAPNKCISGSCSAA